VGARDTSRHAFLQRVVCSCAETACSSATLVATAAGSQAREFSESVRVSGIVLTKVDGAARGGAVVSVVDELALPVKFLGVGEGVDDLQPFDSAAFVASLFPDGDAASARADVGEALLQ
jgi:signal recognition particle GTPase